MGFKKLGLFLIVIFLFLIHLLPLLAQPSLNTSTDITDQKIGRGKGMTGRFEVATGLQRLIAVNRKGGGGGGGHGGGHAGGRSTGTGAHGGEAKGNGDAGATHGSTVVPLYAAGAMNHHQYNSHHHGSNEGSPNYAVSSCLVLVALAVILLEYFA